VKTAETCPHERWVPLYDAVRDYEHHSAAHPSSFVSFVRCARCGLVRQEPVPSADELRARYPDDYRAHVTSDAPSLLGRAIASLKAVQAELLIGTLRRFLPAKAAAILEIGCGAGHLLRQLRAKGFEHLHGVDLNPALGPPLEAAGIRFTACDLEHDLARDLGLDLGVRFHTIIMNNVVEHLADPERVLMTCAALLEPGGQLLVFTPNTASLSHRLFGHYWSGLHAPRHVFMHRPSTLRAAAAALGFEDVDISFPADPASWALSAQNFVEAHRPASAAPLYGTKPYALGLLPLFYPLAIAESGLGRGSSMLVRLARPSRTVAAKPAIEDQERP
jgi:2-polyprenyl-3-methyl-5-hydroxy-6-metoxy-1,4-benzoquinol methylase